MNNQLRKIVGQAVSAIDIVTGNEALDDELAKMYIPDCFAEKFAELIVLECIDIAQDRANFPGFPPNDVNDIIDEIRGHFGVEQ